MVSWNVTMKNGKSYIIGTENNKVDEMLELLFQPNTINTWKLLNSGDETITYIAIRNDDISTVAYMCE